MTANARTMEETNDFPELAELPGDLPECPPYASLPYISNRAAPIRGRMISLTPRALLTKLTTPQMMDALTLIWIRN